MHCINFLINHSLGLGYLIPKDQMSDFKQSISISWNVVTKNLYSGLMKLWCFQASTGDRPSVSLFKRPVYSPRRSSEAQQHNRRKSDNMKTKKSYRKAIRCKDVVAIHLRETQCRMKKIVLKKENISTLHGSSVPVRK